MTKTSYTDKTTGVYSPFEEKSWLWTSCPYLVFLLVNLLYLPVFLAFVLGLIALVLPFGGILVVGFVAYKLLAEPLWISIKYKDGEAKSRLKKLWALDPAPTNPENSGSEVDLQLPDGEIHY